MDSKKLYDKILNFNTKVDDKGYELENPDKYINLVDQLYLKSIDEQFYWVYCNFDTYEKEYSNNLNSFISKYPDSKEIDFIECEIYQINETFESEIEHHPPFIKIPHYKLNSVFLRVIDINTNANIFNQIYYSQRNKIEYLNKKKTSLILNPNQSDNKNKSVSKKSNITFQGSQTDFIELVKALVENESLKGNSQKEIIKLLSEFLNIKINNPDKLIQDLKKRNNGSETLFLNSLKETLYDYISSN